MVDALTPVAGESATEKYLRIIKNLTFDQFIPLADPDPEDDPDFYEDEEVSDDEDEIFKAGFKKMEIPIGTEQEQVDYVLSKYDVSPLGTKKNWVTRVGGLPLFVRAIAHALERKGHSESDAIRIALGALRHFADSKNTTAKTKAKAGSALAEWEAKRAASRAKTAVKSTADDAKQAVEKARRELAKGRK